MKKHHVLSLICSCAAVVLLVANIGNRYAAAATGSIYINPSSQSVQINNTFTVNVRINPGTTVDSVQGTVNYDVAKVQFVSVDTSGSAFGTELQNTQGSGTVNFARGDFGSGVSSDALIESITFKALAGSGSGSIALSGANADAGGSFTNPAAIDGAVSFTTPAATCPSGQTGTPPNCTTPAPAGGSGGSSSTGSSGSAGSAAAPGKHAATAPTATVPAKTTSSALTAATPSVGNSSVQFTLANLPVTTSTPARTYCKIGITKDNLDVQTPLTPLATTHTITLDDKTLIPGQTYYYVVVAQDAQGHTAQTPVQSFTTKGLTVSVGVFDKNHQPIKNKSVILHSSPITAKTDSRGIATFQDVQAGSHQVLYTQGGKSYSAPVTVVNNVKTDGAVQSSALQNYSVVYDLVQSSFALPKTIGIVMALLILAVAAFLFARRSKRLVAPGGVPLSTEPIIVGGSAASAQRYEMPAPSTPSSQALDDALTMPVGALPPAPGSTFGPPAATPPSIPNENDHHDTAGTPL